MNRAILRLFAVIGLLFALLVGFTSRWTVFSATALQNNSLNRLAVYASWKIKRGELLADNGAVLANSVRAAGGTWTRKYPFGSLFAQPVGYSLVQYNQVEGLERYRASALGGVKNGLASVFGQLSTNTRGNDVHTTLDPTAQELARALLKGRTGSVVAIVPQTGAVKVMYSNPSFNDNTPNAKCKPAGSACYLNLATQAGFPPGSTFKVVTTTAALDSGKYTPTSVIVGNSPLTVSGVPLENDANQSWGPISLTTALTNSVNTVFAQVGQNLGAKVMQTYMQRFGFYSTPPLDYPANQMLASGERNRTTQKLLLPTHPCTTASNCVDLGRMSIGQDKLGVTPLQMAMVVATVADGGVLMRPRLTTEVVNPDGQVVERFPPTEYDRVMKPAIAKELTQMMEDVVEEGTGTPAQLDGIKVAGKTGTASTGGTQNGQPLDDAWFIGFAPVSDPKIAVAVTLEKIPNGYGGTYAAPIAAQVIKTLLAEDR